MELNPSAKKKLAVLGIALAGLAIDRGLVFSGGSDAAASDTPGQTPAAQATPDSQPTPAAPVIEVASTLESLRNAIAGMDIDRDAFRLPELLKPAPEADPIPTPIAGAGAGAGTGSEPGEIAPTVEMPTFEVTSIIASSTGSPMAVINGVAIRVGETRDGVTLVSVSARVATIRYADQTVNVPLSE